MAPAVFAIVEQMGHVRFGARCVEELFAGASMLKCEVLAPEGAGVLAVRRINGTSLYAFTECDEATARAANKNRWEVSRAVPSLPSSVIDAVETHDPFEDEETVVEALSLVDAFTADDVPSLAFVHEQVSHWNDEQRFAAWNWAIRLHLNDPEAYPLPSRPPHIDTLRNQPSTTSAQVEA